MQPANSATPLPRQHRPRLRVLALHSFRTSGDIFRLQFAHSGLDTALSDLVELVYLTSPHPASGAIPDDVIGAFPKGPYFEWFRVDKAKDGQELVYTYHHLLESERFVLQAVRDLGPFDGIAGFSQGGAMASMIAALQAAGLALTDVPPLRFVMLFGSVPMTHPRYEQAFAARVRVPSVHLIGQRDPVKDHSVTLVRRFEAPLVIMHARGHVVPPLERPHLAALRAFLAAVADAAAPPRSTTPGGELDPLEPASPPWEQQNEGLSVAQRAGHGKGAATAAVRRLPKL